MLSSLRPCWRWLQLQPSCGYPSDDVNVITQKALHGWFSNLACTWVVMIPQVDWLYKVMGQGSRLQHQKMWWFCYCKNFHFLTYFKIKSMKFGKEVLLGGFFNIGCPLVQIRKFGILLNFNAFPSGLLLVKMGITQNHSTDFSQIWDENGSDSALSWLNF